MHVVRAVGVAVVAAAAFYVAGFAWWIVLPAALALVRELVFDAVFDENSIVIPPLSTQPDRDVKAPSKRICVVTGAAGFVGKAMVEGLIAQGKYDTIRALDVVRPKFTHSKVECIQGNILDLGLLLQHFEGAEAVFHVASMISLRESDPFRYRLRLVNVLGCRNVLEASIRRGVRRFIYTSSATVGFDGSRQIYSEKNCQENPPALVSSYGRTKKEAENLVLKSNGVSGLRTAALRPFMIFGDGDNYVLKMIFQGSPSIPSTKPMSTCYVGNLVHWELLADEGLEKKPEVVGGQAYFVADDEEISTKDQFDDYFTKVLNKKYEALNMTVFASLCRVVPTLDWFTNGYFKGELWELGPSTDLHSRGHSQFDISKGIRELGYERKFNRDQISKIVREYYKISPEAAH